MGNSITLRLPRSETSRLTREHSIASLVVCIVVSERVVFTPLASSFQSRASVQNEVFDPESRNAYVSTFLS